MCDSVSRGTWKAVVEKAMSAELVMTDSTAMISNTCTTTHRLVSQPKPLQAQWEAFDSY